MDWHIDCCQLIYLDYSVLADHLLIGFIRGYLDWSGSWLVHIVHLIDMISMSDNLIPAISGPGYDVSSGTRAMPDSLLSLSRYWSHFRHFLDIILSLSAVSDTGFRDWHLFSNLFLYFMNFLLFFYFNIILLDLIRLHNSFIIDLHCDIIIVWRLIVDFVLLKLLEFLIEKLQLVNCLWNLFGFYWVKF